MSGNKTQEAIAELLEAANEALDFIDNYVDVVDGDYGQPAPNKAMKVHIALKNAVLKAEDLKWNTTSDEARDWDHCGVCGSKTWNIHLTDGVCDACYEEPEEKQ